MGKNLINFLDKIKDYPLGCINLSESVNYRGWYNREDRYKGQDVYKVINRIAYSHIGDSYDNYYSKVCKAIPYHRRSRRWINNLFTGCHNNYNDLIVKNGIILLNPDRYKRKNKAAIISEDYVCELVHIATGRSIREFRPVNKLAKVRYGYTSVVDYYIKDRAWSPNGYMKDQKLADWDIIIAKPSEFEKRVISGSIIHVSSVRDYRYKKWSKERRDADRKLDRLFKKEKREKVYSFLTISELKLKVNKVVNDFKIVKHGFDLKTSFRQRKEE